MTDRQQLIVPPLDLVEKWANDFVPRRADAIGRDWEIAFATRAAQWGADQELQACCEVLHQHDRAYLLPSQLRAARRPKPPSLKQLGLALVEQHKDGCQPPSAMDWETLRLALEQLND